MINLNERMLAFVPRWTIAPRVNNQSVAEHSYFVAVYTGRLCRLFEFTPEQTAAALEYALMHDIEEFLYSDIPGPAKKRAFDELKAEAYFHEFVDEAYSAHVGEILAADDEIKRVVKIADLLDALCWTFLEVEMGNRLLRSRFDVQMNRLRVALKDHPEILEAVRHEFAETALLGIKLPEYPNG